MLGAGGTARVYKGMYAGKLVAVKEIAATAMLPHGRAEAALLSSLRHPYVLHFFGCCVHERHLYAPLLTALGHVAYPPRTASLGHVACPPHLTALGDTWHALPTRWFNVSVTSSRSYAT